MVCSIGMHPISDANVHAWNDMLTWKLAHYIALAKFIVHQDITVKAGMV